MSKIHNILRNGIYSVVYLAFTTILTIIIRKLFVVYFPIEFLGINGLYSNILGLLSLADLGIASIINYNLYQELTKKNNEQINKLMSIYQRLYLVIGIFVFFIGIIFYFLLPFFIKEKDIPWLYVKVVYIIQLLSTVSTYFLAYRRTLLITDQKEYVCVKIDTVFLFIKNILLVISIVVFKNFILYSSIGLVTNLLANLIIYHRCGKEYAFLKKTPVSKVDLKKLHLFKDIKYLLIGKIGGLVYFNTDNIIISSILGLGITGINSNYVMVDRCVNSFVTSAMKGITPTIGNIIYSDDKNLVYDLYKKIDFIYILVASILASGYLTCFQPFITLLFGENYLLPYGYVICLSINTALAIQFQAACDFRSTYGKFENDSKYFLFSAITNLIASIILVKFWGIIGIIVGTILGLCFILYSRIQFVYRIIFNQSFVKYLLHHLLYTILMALELCGVKFVCELITVNNWATWILRGIVSTVLILVLQVITYSPIKSFRELIKYIRDKVIKRK